MLKRIKIQGYKSLVDVEVHLQPLTVLFGPNASGKSNFLDALQLLSRIAVTDNLRYAFPPYRGTPLESFTFGPDGIQGLLTQEKVTFTIEADVELSQPVIDYVNQQIAGDSGIKKLKEGGTNYSDSNVLPVHEKWLHYRIEIESMPKKGILRVANEDLTVLNAQGEPVGVPITRDKSNASALQSMLSTLIYQLSPYVIALRREMENWFFYYLEPLEHMRLRSPLKEVRHIGMMGEDLPAFLNTLKVLDEAQFKAIEDALHMLIPEITGIDVAITGTGEVMLRLMQNTIPVPLNVLSEGTLRILAMLTLGSVKEPPSLLVLEEPENGIHPDRLDLIGSLLKNLSGDNTQVIVTTHSPTLLDTMPVESLYLTRQIDGSTSIIPLSSWRAGRGGNRLVSERLLRGDFNV